MKMCAFCGVAAEGNFSIDRDGFGVGPTVDLCDACGGSEEPTCGDIWARIGRGSECVRCDEEIRSGDERVGSFHAWCFERTHADRVQGADARVSAPAPFNCACGWMAPRHITFETRTHLQAPVAVLDLSTVAVTVLSLRFRCPACDTPVTLETGSTSPGVQPDLSATRRRSKT